ncbi:MAG: hypothetical protein GWO16_08640 [Gammaproteobacteria bacterium]|nr:hypothetical protein [Gammaproteobacteria bacterium]NIR98003.1 hypothetical protein [Gammaproteobacteria bacterium]NIT63698.1 hypothetical protein [Gammaproteobacteria bacterium]NIY32278.1 hypothetical protein [Gammaproteobacteria bacterium]
MAVKIAYVSQTDREPVSPSEIRYRDSFLLAAQVVADALAAPQRIGPMTATEQRQEGVDLIVHLGRGYR